MPTAYTVAEVMAILRVCRTTVEAMIRDGELPSYRIRNRVFIPGAPFRSYLAERGVEVAA